MICEIAGLHRLDHRQFLFLFLLFLLLFSALISITHHDLLPGTMQDIKDADNKR